MNYFRLVVAGAVVLSAAPAFASTSYYNGLWKGHRSNADLQAATMECDARVGIVAANATTPKAYKTCMLRYGWRYDHAERASADAGYEDPDNPGLVCHDFTIGGVTGSSCSNF